jgi:glycerate kinase
MAYALGVRFYDSLGNSFMPVGESLDKVKKIDISNLDNRLSTVEIITMCDIDNPPYGKQGAAYVFAPQKGASEKVLKKLFKENPDMRVEEAIRLALKQL